MIPILTLLPILGFILIWKRLTGRGTGTAIFLSVSSITVILFISALFGLLRPAAAALKICGLCSLLIYICKSRSALSRHLDTPLVIFMSVVIIFWFIHRGSYFKFYDELAHWGIFIKELYYNHIFWTIGPHIRHPSYVPGAPVWIYFVISSGVYSEGAAYFAQFILLFSPLVLFFEGISRKQWLWIIITLAWFALCLANWGHGIADIHTDHLISVWFAGTLLYGVSLKNEKYATFFLIFPLCLLALIKDNGIFFSLSAAVIIFLHQAADAGRFFKRSLIFQLIFWILPPLICITAWKAERAYQKISTSTGIEEIYSRLITRRPETNLNLQKTINKRFWTVVFTQHISKGEPSRQFNVFNYFNKHFYTSKFRRLPFPLTTALFISIYALTALIIVIWLKRAYGNWKKRALMFTALLLMSVIYLFIMNNYYITFLPGTYTAEESGSDGLHISSYMRYAHSMLMVLPLILTASLLPNINSAFGKNKKTSLILFGFITFLFYILDPPYLKPFFQTQKISPFRAQIKKAAEALIKDAPAQSRIWAHWPIDDNQHTAWIIKYHLTPLKTYANKDPDFFKKTLNEITTIWIDYDLIWCPLLNENEKDFFNSISAGNLNHKKAIPADLLISKISEFKKNGENRVP